MQTPLPDDTSPQSLIEEGTHALQAGDRATARRLLLQAVQHDPDNAQGWMGLAGAVESDAERRYCLEWVLTNVDSHHTAAQVTLDHLPQDVLPVSPLTGEQMSPILPAQAVEAVDSETWGDSARSASATDEAEAENEAAEAPEPSALKRFWNWLWEDPKTAKKTEETVPETEVPAAPEDTNTTQTEALTPVEPIATEEPAPVHQEEPAPVHQDDVNVLPAEAAPEESPKPRILLAPSPPVPEPGEDDRIRQLLTMQPWRTIWQHPQETIQKLIALDPPNTVVLLAILDGMNTILDLLFYAFTGAALANLLTWGLAVSLALVAGPFVGIISLYVWGWTMRQVGGWLHSTMPASAEQIRMIAAWAAIPRLASLVLALLLLLVLLPVPVPPLIVVWLCQAIEVGLFVWSVVIFVRCLAVISRLPISRALVITLISMLMVYIPLAATWYLLALAVARSF